MKQNKPLPQTRNNNALNWEKITAKRKNRKSARRKLSNGEMGQPGMVMTCDLSTGGKGQGRKSRSARLCLAT